MGLSKKRFSNISIHAPPRGATKHRIQINTLCDFNSRPSARGDLAKSSFQQLQVISIHAPPRGATLKPCIDTALHPISIHAPPRGATQPVNSANCPSDFNSRPSARGDPCGRHSKRAHLHFNSRPSARGDFKFRKEKNNEYISIHAPPRGATRVCVVISSARTDFNSRPSARGDRPVTYTTSFRSPFQFTPLREGRRMPDMDYTSSEIISIHAPPRGATSPYS